MVGCWHGYLSRARCKLAYGPADATVSSSVKSRLILPFWYRLTRVVPEKGPLRVYVLPILLIWYIDVLLWNSTIWKSRNGKCVLVHIYTKIKLTAALLTLVAFSRLQTYGDSVGNAVEENSSIFSIIQMHWLPSARACGQ